MVFQLSHSLSLLGPVTLNLVDGRLRNIKVMHFVFVSIDLLIRCELKTYLLGLTYAGWSVEETCCPHR
jgi:hypothetical protein